MTKLIITGGGSGGHMYPAYSVLRRLLDNKTIHMDEVIWICSSAESDKAFMNSLSIPYISIPAGKLRRYSSFRNLTDIGKILAGSIKSLFILMLKRPNCVFSKGGYVSVPVVFAAWICHIPVVSHESDISPGLATRINAYFSKTICLPVKESYVYLSKKNQTKAVICGNPIRFPVTDHIGSRDAELWKIKKEVKNYFSFPPDSILVFVTGGSQGASSLNTLIWQVLSKIPKNICLIHSLGKNETRQPPKFPNYVSFPYIHEMYEKFLKSSHMVISRAGANTIWEQAFFKKPMILVPLGNLASRGEQKTNAHFFMENRAAIVVENTDGTEALLHAILSLSNNLEETESMGERAFSLLPHAGRGASLIAEQVEKIVKEGITCGSRKN
ncbi:MAG: UDP-N-acetylglucosamine--N-acetylmuramyl-(pentapeptide) pyrophosphoryl-undecaprenol N-acetylglucosamine transferase [Spirochaetia bacterium]|nr:UDP-N-acetylglucosamine--N-acetylmuramyl-(pentapeptide) pyrophosphoryl-undecaprenol N-acetylglucosamine transferase [Spirochaetia bacterium]